MERGSYNVVFAVLPFADVNRPAIGVSLLQGGACLRGFTSRIEYLDLHFAEMTGYSLYQRIAHEFAPDFLVGEWFFADAVFGDAIPDERDYLTKVLARVCPPHDQLFEDIVRARKLREPFLRECEARILACRPRVVGLTTTFHQTCACLAVAQRLKASPHPPLVVFGGANCEGDMGRQMIASFPWIDYVCLGEADLSFPDLLEDVLRKRGASTPAGVLKRGEANEPVGLPPPAVIDSLPLPDYADYFAQARQSPLLSELRKGIPVETSRGCWWGAKQRCNFCGLNGNSLSFRSKSPMRAFSEMTYLARTWNSTRIESTDNMLDLGYIRTLFPMLKGRGLDLFYEVKANLRYDQLTALHAAGVRGIQPGIESLSDEVLGLMHKGTTAAQNLQLLRWCEELGIEAAWNMLGGIPGEPPSEYERMREMVPLLVHLAPPVTCVPIRLDRFSPFFQRPEEFGFTRVRPAFAYFYVFPLGRRELFRLGYFFDYNYRDGRAPGLT